MRFYQFEYIKLYYDGKAKLLKKIFIRQNVITLFLTLFCYSVILERIFTICGLIMNFQNNIQSIIYLIILVFFISTGVSLITVLKSFNKGTFFQ